MRLSRTGAADVRQAVVNEAPDELVDDAIVALSSDLARRNELQVAQKRELMTDGGHREAERVRQIAYAELVVRERVHQPQAHRVGERMKDLDGFGDDVFGRQPGADALDLLCIDGGGQRGRLHS